MKNTPIITILENDQKYLRGKIVDYDNNPLSGITVNLEEKGWSDLTDENGLFWFNTGSLDAGAYSLTLSRKFDNNNMLMYATVGTSISVVKESSIDVALRYGSILLALLIALIVITFLRRKLRKPIPAEMPTTTTKKEVR